MELWTYLSFPPVVVASLETIPTTSGFDNQQAALRSSKKGAFLITHIGKGDSMP